MVPEGPTTSDREVVPIVDNPFTSAGVIALAYELDQLDSLALTAAAGPRERV